MQVYAAWIAAIGMSMRRRGLQKSFKTAHRKFGFEIMDRNYPNWMWSEACAMLVRAERLHRQVFRLTASVELGPAWEPPVDILETGLEVLIFVGLPGVDPNEVEAVIDGSDLLVAGARHLSSALRTATIHRMELPQGRFERRIELPAGRYRHVRRSVVDGCVLITLEKMEASHG